MQLNCTREEFEYLFERTRIIKQRFKSYRHLGRLTDRALVIDVFEKASTRTRLFSRPHGFGGSAIVMNTRRSQTGTAASRWSPGQVISRMSDIVMIRTFEQSIIERFAANSRVPVIDGLSQRIPPRPGSLADIYTYIEQQARYRARPCHDHDPNNIYNTWAQAAEVLDFNVHVSTPPGG